jgi:glycosyltransferase involved in cell wall biosynthesis
VTFKLANSSVPRVIIATGEPFFRKGERIWIPPMNWKSLNQWWNIFDNVMMFMPESDSTTCPDGWREAPARVQVHKASSLKDNFWTRRRSAHHAARELLQSTDVLLARIPQNEALWCYQVARKQNIRLILEIHGDWESSYLEEDSNSLLRRLTRRFRATHSRRMVEEMAANSTCVFSIGPQFIEKYVPKGVPSYVSTNNLTQEAEYCRRKDFTLKKPPRILFVGVLQRRKGLHILFDALSILHNQGRCFEMVLVGKGHMREILEKYASDKGFSDSVRFLGTIPHSDKLLDQFKNSDVTVLPSIAAEGVPRVTHEAMTQGCPTIATDIGSTAWQLQGGAGIVIQPNDTDGLVAALSSVLDDESLRRSLSEKGFDRALEYTYEKQQSAMHEFIKAQGLGNK